MIAIAGRVASLAIAALVWAAPAAAQTDGEDWPCVQRLVPELTAAQMWAGPPLDETEGFWQADPLIAPLVIDLVDIREDEAVVREMIAEFAQGLDETERVPKLTLLFKAVLETLNGERADMIRTILAFSQKQQQLAERIADANAQLQGLRLDVEPDDRQRDLLAIREMRDWDLKIFDDRYAMLNLICEQPVRLEQRAFMLARTIQENLP